jgi:hypothetical protein
MGLENIMLKEVRPKKQMYKYLYEVSTVDILFFKTQSRIMVARSLFDGYRVSIWEEERAQEMDRSDGCKT